MVGLLWAGSAIAAPPLRVLVLPGGSDGGVVEIYMNNNGIKGCGSNTYTVQRTTITYATGNPNEMAVTDTTLGLTTLQGGGDSGYVAVGYSDFVRLTIPLESDGRVDALFVVVVVSIIFIERKLGISPSQGQTTT